MTDYLIPVWIVFILIYGMCKKVNVFSSFLSGAKEGISTAFGLLPTLIAITVCIGMLKASGGLDLIAGLLSFPAKLLSFPKEVLPLALLRPISGSGALVIYENILKSFGPDSEIGQISSVLLGSSETTFYTMTVYYAAVSVKRTKYTLGCSLAGDITCFLCSALWVRLLG